MSIFICQFCGAAKANSNSFKNHRVRCKANPDRKISKGFTGRAHTDESKAKNRAAQLQRPAASEETRKKRSVNHRSNNTIDTNEKISVAMKQAHSEGRAWNIGKSRWNNQPSYPETFFAKVIANEFDDKRYRTEYSIGIYSADFCWPHLKKVIEIDGDQHQRFEEYRLRDQRKDLFLQTQGYKILRLNWKELFSNTKAKIKEAYEFIHND